MNLNTFGIITNIRDFSEADKLVTFFTKDYGVVEVIAKSARKSTSRKSSKIELLNRCKILFTKSKSIPILLELELIDTIDFNNRPELINYIFYFCELLSKTFSKGLEIEEVYEKISEIRETLSEYRFIAILLVQLMILNFQGALPELKNCVVCSRDLTNERFLNGSIGYFCREHGDSSKPIDDRTLKIQNFLIMNITSDCLNLNISEKDFLTISKIQNNWIEESIDRKFKSLSFIGS